MLSVSGTRCYAFLTGGIASQESGWKFKIFLFEQVSNLEQ
jgi:hypothetical protein